MRKNSNIVLVSGRFTDGINSTNRLLETVLGKRWCILLSHIRENNTLLIQGNIIAAYDSGAAFGLAPGYKKQVAAKALDLDFPFISGVLTPFRN